MSTDLTYRHMHRFGGWAARWIADAAMMVGTAGRWTSEYSNYWFVEGARTHEVRIYVVGLVDLSAEALAILVPDVAMRAALMNKTEEEFHALAGK